MCESIGHRPLQGRCPKSMSSSFINSDDGDGSDDDQQIRPTSTFLSRPCWNSRFKGELNAEILKSYKKMYTTPPKEPSIRVVSAQISKTENSQKIEFAFFWCKGTPWGVIQESRIFLLSDPYFGFYGGLKF